VGFWGPELDYRFRRAGLFRKVVFFPSAVTRHPGWYDEKEAPDASLRAEAMALSEPSAARPSLFVLPRGSRASAALSASLEPNARIVFSNPIVDVVERP